MRDIAVPSQRGFHNLTSTLLRDRHLRQPDDRLTMHQIVRTDPPIRGPVAPPSEPGAPDPPTGLHQTGRTTSSVTVAWNANTEGDLAGYWVYRRVGNGTYQRQGAMVPAGTETATVTGLQPSITYFIRVTAVDTTLLESDPSGIILADTADPSANAPLAPTGLVLTADVNSVQLNWNDVANADSYRVFKSNDGTTWPSVPAVNSLVSQANVSGLNASTKYWFRVVARNAAGDSPPSAVKAITTDDSPTPPPPGGGSTILIPVGMFDDTGTLDITDDLSAYLNTRPDGLTITRRTRVVFPAKRANGQRAVFRMDGGVNGKCELRGLTNYIIDGGGTPGNLGRDGCQFIQRNGTGSGPKDPINVARPVAQNGDPSFWVHQGPTAEHPLLTNSDWTVQWIPAYGDPSVRDKRTWDTEEQAKQQRDTLNRTRVMWAAQFCKQMTFVHCEMKGAYNGGAFNDSYEGADGIRWEGSTDCEVKDCKIWSFWGNTQEAVRYDDDPGDPHFRWGTIGLWIHNCDLRRTGRQILSFTYGGRYIVEDSYLGDSQRSLIDCEPVSSTYDHRLVGGSGISQTVDGVFLQDLTIGTHGLGMLATHPGTLNVRVDGLSGSSPGTSGTCLAENVVWENTVSNRVNPPHTLCTFGREDAGAVDNNTGRDYGGRNLVVQDCSGTVGAVGVELGGQCDNFRFILSGGSFHNLSGAQLPNVDTHGQSNSAPFDDSWLTGTNRNGRKTIAFPPHALRDLAT